MKDMMYTVTVGDTRCEYPEGTTYQQIALDFQEQYPYDIVGVFVGGFRLQELTKKIVSDCDLQFITTKDTIGFMIYQRSLCMLMCKAVHDVGGADVGRVRILYSISKGFYCEIEGEVVPDRDFLDRVEERMQEMVDQKLPITKRTVHTDEAISLFHEYGMHDRGRIFEYRRVSKVNVYSMNQYDDYYYGYMVPDAGYLRYFKLQPYDDGFVMQFPLLEKPEEIPEFKLQPKLFKVRKESTKWGDLQNLETVGDLNEIVTKHNMLETVLVQEAHQDQRIAAIAAQILEKPEVKFILVAGPSSSGKTTFSQKLAIQLRTAGMHPHTISVDNYFVNREDTPLDEDGNYNFECIEAIDVELFNQDMNRLLAGEDVVLPTFDFETGRKRYTGAPMRLGEQDILVIEGIHCLNPKMTAGLADDKKFKIYISALTQLNIDEHNRVPSTDGRLLRRIVRDARTRGASAARTISMWPSVRRGEEKYIFPYQEEADVMFNSALIYELAVLKHYVEPLLYGIDKNTREYTEAKRLLKFLDYFVGIGSDCVPNTSLLREFIGGGCFRL